jgi:hypothetical protein
MLRQQPASPWPGGHDEHKYIWRPWGMALTDINAWMNKGTPDW